MSKFVATAISKFTHRFARVLLATSLAACAVPVGSTLFATPAAAVTFRAHGAWAGFSSTSNGSRVLGVRTDMDNGGFMLFAIADDGTMSIEMSNPEWRLNRGSQVSVSLTVDNSDYDGTAVVRGRSWIEIPDVTKEVFAMFIRGAVAVIDLDGESKWTLDLHGFTAALGDAFPQS